jgi:hypothetical protein
VRNIFVLGLLLLAAPAQSAPEPPLDQAALKAHIAYLADDALEGRKPGTEGGVKAAHYVASQFQAIGLQPGAPDGGWYQPVALLERTPGSTTQSWHTRQGALQLDDANVLFTARDAKATLAKAQVLFAGYGLDRPEQGFNDLKGVDIAGKVVLLISGRPEAAHDAPGLEVRRAAIARAGAAAVIALTGPSDPWDIIRDQLGRGRTSLASEIHAPLEGALAFPAWTELLKAAGVDPVTLSANAAKPGFRAVPLDLTLDATAESRLRPFESANVIAKLPGKGRAGEGVLFLAHWDHLGICRPAGAPDRICNGAVDNASGVALLIEVARRLQQGPKTRRSLYFVATTAEEMGLIGARVLVANPPIPRDHIVVAINFDTVAVAPAGEPVAVIGRGRTMLDPIIDAAVRKQNRRIDASDASNAFITRQDGWELLKAGIPAVMVGGAFSDAALLATFLTGNYHKPSDDLSKPIPLAGAAEDGALHVVLGRMLADPAVLPRR